MDDPYDLLSNIAGKPIDSSWMAGYHLTKIVDDICRGKFNITIRCICVASSTFGDGLSTKCASMLKNIKLDITEPDDIPKCKKMMELSQSDIVFIGAAPLDVQISGLTLSTTVENGVLIMDITETDARIVSAASILFGKVQTCRPEWGFGKAFMICTERNPKKSVRFLMRGELPDAEEPVPEYAGSADTLERLMSIF